MGALVTRFRPRLCLLIVCSALTAGCTTIRIEGAEPKVERHFGVLKISPTKDAGVLVFQVRGAGLVPGATGVTIGYAAETVAYFYDPKQCRVVLFAETSAGVDAFFSALKTQGATTANICDVSPKEMP